MVIKDISKSYKNKAVLKDLDLTVKDKEFLVILGSSGSGKSTLLKIIAGVEDTDSGTITQDLIRIDKIPMQKRDIGYIFQEPLLFPHMTVRQNVSYSLTMAKKDRSEIESESDEFMNLLQIKEFSEQMPSELSGGQKQRVAIARALINSPRMLLMDEPFSSLDYNLRIQMGKMLKRLKEQLGLTVIFVTHDINESMFLADRIAFLHEGNLIELNTPQEMYYNPINEETAKFMGDYNIIEGEYKNGKYYTKYGTYETLNDYSLREKIYIRPNKVRVIKNKSGSHKIESIILNGKETRITIQNDPILIDTYFSDEFKIGEHVDIVLDI